MKTILLVLASGAAIVAGTPAHAVVVSLNYDLTGSNFLQSFGPATPA